jgi:hypothetical protein
LPGYFIKERRGEQSIYSVCYSLLSYINDICVGLLRRDINGFAHGILAGVPLCTTIAWYTLTFKITGYCSERNLFPSL